MCDNDKPTLEHNMEFRNNQKTATKESATAQGLSRIWSQLAITDKISHYPAVIGRDVGGFSFDLVKRSVFVSNSICEHPYSQVASDTSCWILTCMLCRNAMLGASGKNPPKYLKTGTTICGVVFKVWMILLNLSHCCWYRCSEWSCAWCGYASNWGHDSMSPLP